MAEITIRTGELPEARDKFIDLNGPFITQGFEGLQNTPDPLVLGPLTITATRDLHIEVENERAITQGRQALGFEEEYATEVTFTFAHPITAFAVDINDLSYTGATLTDDLGNHVDTALAADDGSDLGGPGFINRQFIGILNDTPFSSITFDAVSYRPAALIHSKSHPTP